jgi:hypothetical protein
MGAAGYAVTARERDLAGIDRVVRARHSLASLRVRSGRS